MSSRCVVLGAVVALLGGCEPNDRVRAAQPEPDGGPFVVNTIRFVPDESPAKGAFWLELVNADPQSGQFTLRLAGDGLDVYGVAGRLTMSDVAPPRLTSGDGRRCRFVEATAGEALGSDGASVLAMAREIDEGLVFGFSRTGDQVAATLRAEATVGRLVFEARFEAPGECRFAWVPRQTTALGADLRRMSESRFIGGLLTVE